MQPFKPTLSMCNMAIAFFRTTCGSVMMHSKFPVTHLVVWHRRIHFHHNRKALSKRLAYSINQPIGRRSFATNGKYLEASAWISRTNDLSASITYTLVKSMRRCTKSTVMPEKIVCLPCLGRFATTVCAYSTLESTSFGTKPTATQSCVMTAKE